MGQKDSKLRKIEQQLRDKGAMDYTIIISAGLPLLQLYNTLPHIQVLLLQNILWISKKDVLIIYDDLSKHAVSYREISLLLRRPPGREAYPGRMIHLHSRLLKEHVGET